MFTKTQPVRADIWQRGGQTGAESGNVQELFFRYRRIGSQIGEVASRGCFQILDDASKLLRTGL